MRILKSKNLVFNDLMETPNGHTYLAALTLMNVNKVDSVKNLDFEPKRQKNKDTNKVGAYYV